jgi:hypothetical protein
MKKLPLLAVVGFLTALSNVSSYAGNLPHLVSPQKQIENYTPTRPIIKVQSCEHAGEVWCCQRTVTGGTACKCSYGCF